MAEFLLASKLGDAVNWVISSAGTQADDGRRMHPHAASVLQARGFDPSQFRSRRLTSALVRSADLVLTAEAAHRSATIGLSPQAIGRTFTIREFARLISPQVAADATRPYLNAASAGHSLIAAAIANRSRFQPVVPPGDDLADPIKGRLRAFRRCARTTDDLLTQIAQRLHLH